MNSIDRRLSRLEGATGIGKARRPVGMLIGDVGETHDDIRARYLREHPGAEDHTDFVLIRIVSPTPPEESWRALPDG
jgi:hypothetical protein